METEIYMVVSLLLNIILGSYLAGLMQKLRRIKQGIYLTAEQLEEIQDFLDLLGEAIEDREISPGELEVLTKRAIKIYTDITGSSPPQDVVRCAIRRLIKPS